MAKACVTTSRRLFYALDQFSKNTWIDVISNHARVHYLCDPRIKDIDITDAGIAEKIQILLDPVLAIRNDKYRSLARMMADYDARIERYKAACAGEVLPISGPRPGDAKLDPRD